MRVIVSGDSAARSVPSQPGRAALHDRDELRRSGLSDLELFALPGMRAALANRDIGTVYRFLMQAGVVQRVIAQATGQSQSEVCEILKGRQVMAYDVLERIAAGLASVSVRTFAHGTDRREGVLADITLARLHVQTGEPDAPRLAASAISAVAPLRSGIARAGFVPLAAELETRPRSDLRELARRARQVATSPA